MSQEQGGGVNISLREIYDTIQEVRNDVKGLGPQIQKLEGDAAKGVEALDIAKEAFKLASKHDDGFKWLWRTAIGSIVTALMAALVGLMVLGIQLGIRNEMSKIPQQQINVETPAKTTEGGNGNGTESQN